MNAMKITENVERTEIEDAEREIEERNDDEELSIVVKKLEMPVRPRGVLAE